jgi:hypothetical protein
MTGGKATKYDGDDEGGEQLGPRPVKSGSDGKWDVAEKHGSTGTLEKR